MLYVPTTRDEMNRNLRSCLRLFSRQMTGTSSCAPAQSPIRSTTSASTNQLSPSPSHNHLTRPVSKSQTSQSSTFRTLRRSRTRPDGSSIRALNVEPPKISDLPTPSALLSAADKYNITSICPILRITRRPSIIQLPLWGISPGMPVWILGRGDGSRQGVEYA